MTGGSGVSDRATGDPVVGVNGGSVWGVGGSGDAWWYRKQW